jgi:uncharacterized membrane protein
MSTTPIVPSEPARRGVFVRLRDYLITGLIAIAPSVVTLVVVFRLVNWLDSLLGRYLRFSFYDYKRIPGLGIVATLLLLLVIGWMVSLLGSWIGGRSILRMWEHLLTRIPGVGILYGSTKSLGQALLAPKKEAFQQVVLVQWPMPDVWRIGLIAGPPSPEVQRQFSEPVEVVFVPHTPNPASGFVHYVPARSLIHLDWSVEDGLKVVISGGVVQPGIARSTLAMTAPTPAAR